MLFCVRTVIQVQYSVWFTSKEIGKWIKPIKGDFCLKGLAALHNLCGLDNWTGIHQVLTSFLSGPGGIIILFSESSYPFELC